MRQFLFTLLIVASDIISCGNIYFDEKNNKESLLYDDYLKLDSNYFSIFYGGNDFDEAVSIVPIDGGYILSGNTRSFGKGGSDIWVLKTDLSGNIIWEKTYGTSKDETAKKIIKSTEAGYIITGNISNTDGTDGDIIVIKITDTGVIEWQKIIGGPGKDTTCSILQTKDDQYIVSGSSDSFGAGDFDVFITVINPDGSLLTSYMLGYPSVSEPILHDEVCKDYIKTGDNEFMIVGEFNDTSSDSKRVFFYDTDEWGDIGRDKHVGISDSHVYFILKDIDDGYIITGDSFKNTGNSQLWVMKVNSQLERVWAKVFPGDKLGYGKSIFLDENSNYIVTGNTNSFGSDNYDIWILNLDRNGDILKQERFGGAGLDYVHDMKLLTDNNFIIAGYSNSDKVESMNAFIAKFNKDWKIQGSGIEVNETDSVPVDITDVNLSYELPLEYVTGDVSFIDGSVEVVASSAEVYLWVE